MGVRGPLFRDRVDDDPDEYFGVSPEVMQKRLKIITEIFLKLLRSEKYRSM